MARPKKYPEHKVEAYRLYQERNASEEGVSAQDIQLDLEHLHPDGTVSYRLIADWVKEFKQRDERGNFLDSPFQWHLMEEYKLPWEASAYILQLWWMDVEGKLLTLLPELSHGELLEMPLHPTGREVRLWWRVHQAAPSLGFGEVKILAERFVLRELDSEVLDWPIDVADLEAFLAYRPWEGLPSDRTNYDTYQEAISSGRIPRLAHTFLGHRDMDKRDVVAAMKETQPILLKLLQEWGYNPAFFFVDNPGTMAYWNSKTTYIPEKGGTYQ